MSQRKRLFRSSWWPYRLKTAATGSVSEKVQGSEGVDLLSSAQVYLETAANADSFKEAEAKKNKQTRAELLTEPAKPEVEALDRSAQSPPELSPTTKKRGKRPFWRRWAYSLFFFVSMLLIWVPVLSYVTLASPLYNSTWTILIPGTQVDASLDIESVGEANTNVKTPYGGNSFSPGVNFKMIMSSVSVMDAAADRLGMTMDEYGKPKIRVTDQAATLEVVFGGSTPEMAQEKSQALFDAFQAELDRLRKGEVEARREGSLAQLEAYREQAYLARAELALFRDSSSVVSAEQYRALVDAGSKLELSLMEARVNRDAITSRLKSMALLLGVDASRAADVMLLRQDKLVQVLSGEYARLQAIYVEKVSVLGAKHPKVIHAKAKANGARRSMMDRMKRVLGDEDEGLLSSYLPDPKGNDGQLYKDVVSFEAEREALIREISSSEQLLGEMRGRIALAGSDLDRLEELERAHQMAATILVSATSNIDLGRSNIYATYPMTQLLVPPTLPEKPKKLLKILAILGGIVATFLIIFSILLVKYRDRWRRLILKSA